MPPFIGHSSTWYAAIGSFSTAIIYCIVVYTLKQRDLGKCLTISKR
jgi:hypothetical protein